MIIAERRNGEALMQYHSNASAFPECLQSSIMSSLIESFRTLSEASSKGWTSGSPLHIPPDQTALFYRMNDQRQPISERLLCESLAWRSCGSSTPYWGAEAPSARVMALEERIAEYEGELLEVAEASRAALAAEGPNTKRSRKCEMTFI